MQNSVEVTSKHITHYLI